MFWPNRLRHSLQEFPGKQTDPSVDWDLCELLTLTGLLDTDVYPSSYYMSQVNRKFRDFGEIENQRIERVIKFWVSPLA